MGRVSKQASAVVGEYNTSVYNNRIYSFTGRFVKERTRGSGNSSEISRGGGRGKFLRIYRTEGSFLLITGYRDIIMWRLSPRAKLPFFAVLRRRDDLAGIMKIE